MTRAVATIILAAMMLLPGAVATQAEGLFTVEGGIGLPSASSIETATMAFFMGGARQEDPPLEFTHFLIEAESLRLTNFSTNFVAATAPVADVPIKVEDPLAPDHAVRTLRNVTITIEGPLQTGYLALENASPESRSSLLATAPVHVESVARSEFADADGYTVDAVDANPAYRRILDRPHALTITSGDLAFEGGAKMKLFGMTLVVTHDGGQERIRTGGWYETRPTPSSPYEGGTYRMAWVVLASEHIQVRVSSPQEWKVAGGGTSLSWDGEAVFRATSGVMRTSGAAYNLSTGTPMLTSLEGAFQATLDTVGTGAVRSKMTVAGDLEGTNLPATQSKTILPVLSGGMRFLWLSLALGAAVGTGGLLWRHRSQRTRRAPPVSTEPLLSPALAAEYYVGLGEQALQFGEQAKALHYISLAREACPTSADVATTMAFVLGELGHYDEALAAYEEASRLDPSSGEADLNAARLAAQAGKPPEAVEALVVRALERTPEFVFDVEEDLEFRPLAIRPAFRDALARAWDRWGDGEDPAIGR